MNVTDDKLQTTDRPLDREIGGIACARAISPRNYYFFYKDIGS